MNTTQKPPKKDKTNPRHNVPPVPEAAKTTMDFRDTGAVRKVLSGVGTNRPLTDIKEPSMMMWGPQSNSNNKPAEGEAELLEHENQNRKFLPYTNVHTLISETLNRSKDEWLHHHERTRAAVAEAIEILAEQKGRDITDDYTRAKYGLVKGFEDLTQNKKTLYDFEMWLIKKESQYERLSGAYSELRMLSFAPYEQVVNRCREMVQTSEIARDYYIMVGHTSGMNGAGAEDTIEMEDGLTGKTYSTVGELEKLRFDVWLQTRIPMQEENLLTEREGALYRVGELLKTINENDAAHEARRERTYRMLELADEDAYGLEAVAERIEKRVTEMESNFAQLTARLEGRASEELTEDDARRETMVSEEFPVSAAGVEEVGADAEIDAAVGSLGEKVADLTDEAVRDEPSAERFFGSQVIDGIAALQAEEKAAADAAALVEAAKATVKPELPRREITAEIPLEEVEEIKEPKERGRFWKTVPGRVIENIVIYGVAGKLEKKRYPPKKEDYANDLEHSRAGSDYNSWYGQTGRNIRKTLDGTKRNWKAVTAVATGVAVLAAATTGYFMYAPAHERPEQRALSELSKPTVTQVAVVDDKAPEGLEEVEKVEPKPEPLAKLAFADVLAKHNLALEKGMNVINFYKTMGGVEDIQERYVVLEELLKTGEQLEKYERKYSEAKVLGIYANFLRTAMDYTGLEGQTDTEKSNAKEIGERIAKRMQKLLSQKRIKKKLGKERTVELKGVATQFQNAAAKLPVVAEVEEEKLVEVPVVTAEELEEMKKAGEEPETAVIILPDKTDEKPFDVEKEMGKVVTAEFESLDSVSKVNEFNRKADKAEKIEEKFLMKTHLTDQLIEHGMGAKMSEKRVLFMHIDTMNSAIKFAMADGQGMTAIAEALNAFDLANGEVKRFLGYKKMKKDLGKKKATIDKNVKWLRNRAEELKNKVDAYERNKDMAVPLPGSPAVDNGNGAPTVMPETVQLDKGNQFVAMQTVVFSKHGLSILEHPLEVHKKMGGMKINNFDKFIILENLAEKIKGNPRWMDGLTKAEQFDMLRILGAYLRTVKKAANEPKNWAEGYTRDDIMLNSLAIDVSELLKEIRKLGKGNVGKSQGHLQFPLDTETFKELGEAMKEFDELLTYEYRQKRRMKGTNGE